MTWEGELYLEGHNGTFTSMAENKFYNRYVEILLRDVELFFYFTQILKPDAKLNFTHEDFKDKLWYTFLIDQFHDVLPGTCTKLTVDDVRKNFADIKKTTSEVLKETLGALWNRG